MEQNSLFPSAGMIVGGLSPIPPNQNRNPIAQEPPPPTLEEVYAGRRATQFQEMVTGRENPFAGELDRQKSYRTESNMLAGMYADPENLGGLAPEVLDLADASYDPKVFKEMAVNWKATAFLLDTPVDDLKDSDYLLYKKLVAAKLGKAEPKTETEYHAMLGEHFTKQKEMDAAIDELNMAAVVDALNATNYGKDFPMVRDQGRTISEWMSKYPDLATPDRQWLLARSAGEMYQQTLNDLADVREYAAPTYQTLVAFTKGEATEEQIDELGRNLQDLTPEQFNKVGQYVTLAAEAEQIDRGAWTQLAKNLGESLSRGFDFIPAADIFSGQAEADRRLKAVEKDDVWVPEDAETLPVSSRMNPRVANTLPKYLQMASFGKPDEIGYEGPVRGFWRKATPEEKEQIKTNAEEGIKSMKMVRKLRNLAKTGVDPIRPLSQGGLIGAAERGAYGLSGSLPLMAMTAIPYVGLFAGTAAYSAQELDRILLENEDMDLGAAQALSLVEGGMNAVIDRFQISSLMGKSKMLGGVLKGMQGKGVLNYLGRTGVIQVEQFAQEGAQDLIAPVVETIASALREDMPDKDFMAELGNWWETRPEVFFAVLPLALIGGGFASTGDLRNVNTEVTRERLRGLGFAEEKIADILASTTRAEMDSKIQTAWQTRTEEDKARGLAYLNEQLKQSKQTETDHTLAVERKEDGSTEWVVNDYTGQEVGRFADYDAAAEVIRQNVASNLTNDKTSIAELTQWVERVGVLKDPDILLNQAPASVAQDLEKFQGIGDTKRVDNLMARLKFGDLQGKDPNKLFILGETTIEQVRDGVYRAVIKLKENSSPRDAFEEINHGFFKVALANGTYTLDTYQKWLEQTEAATGRELKRATEMEVIESLAQVSEDWVMGRIDDTSMPQSFVDYIKRIAAIFKEALLRFVKMEQAFAKGEIDTDFQTALEQSLGIDPQVRLDRVRDQTAASVETNSTNTQLPAYSIKVQTTAANILADNLGIPKMIPKEYVGRQFIPIEADLTAGGGSFTQKPAQGGPAWSVDPLNYKKDAVWASANDGFWTGKLNLAKDSGAIYIGKDKRKKFLVGTYAMLQTSHVSNPTIAGEKLAEVARYVREGRISNAQEAALSQLIRDAAQSLYDASLAEKKKYENDKSSKNYERARQANTKASALINFPTTFTAQQLEQYIADLSFDQRAFIATQLSTAQAEIIGAPPMGQITRATLDESFGGTSPLSLISLLEIDVKRLEEGLVNRTLTAKDFGIVPHNSYSSIAPGKIVTLFRTPIPYALAMPDIRKGLLDWDTKKKYVNNHGYFLKGRIPVGLPRTQTISTTMRDSWVKTQTNLRPNQAKAIVAALNQKWTRFERVNQAGLVEFPRALVNNDAAVTLTKYTFEEVKAMMKAGTMKVYRLGEMDVWFALKRLGEDEKDFGDPSKDWAIVSVVNNEKGAPGMLPLIMSKALAEGGTILDCYAVKSTKYPDGLLPTLYARSGFEVTATLEFDPQYHSEAGKLIDLEQVWHSQKWDGIEKPPVVYMRWNPELHAKIGTNARDDDAKSELESDASKNEGGMVEGANQRIGRVAEGSPVSMGSEGQGKQGGRVSVSSSSTGDAGDARNILPRGIEQIVADLGKLNKYQLQALGLTKEEVNSAVAIYNSPDSVAYSVRDFSKANAVKNRDILATRFENFKPQVGVEGLRFGWQRPSDGQFIRVSQHHFFWRTSDGEILGDPNGVGYLRIVRAGDTLMYQGDANAKQLKELKDTAIEQGLELMHDPFETSYSIREQSEIDRVAAAVDAVNRGPEGRLAVYQRAKEKFLQLMQGNKDALDAIKAAAVSDPSPAIEKLEEDRAGRLADIETEEIAEVESALQDNAVQFATRIDEAIDPEDKAQLKADAKDRAKILEKGIREKYAERKKQVEQEIAAEKRKVSEVSEARRVAANAVYKEKVRSEKLAQAIAELDGLLKVLPKEVIGKVGGFATLARIGTGDKALAEFFVKRVEMVDEQLERYLNKEYDEELDRIFERAKPKKAKAGEKPKGIGAEIQNLFAVLKEARDFNAREVSAHLAAIDDQIAKGELTAEEEAALKQEAALITLVGNWKPKYQGYTDPTTGKTGYMKVDNGADSNRRAAAVAALRETWARGFAEYRAREIAQRQQREADQQQAILATGKKGDINKRKEKQLADAGLGAKFRNALFNLTSWDQFTGLLFGNNSAVANRVSDLQRRADNQKEDAIQVKVEAIESLFTRLAGGNRLDGEKLRWDMSQMSMKVDGLPLSELEGLTATMMWMQADGKRHMEGRFDENGNRISAWGYTQAFIDKIEGALSPEAKEVRQFLLDNYDREYQRINAVYRQLNGIDLPRIQFYSPLIVAPQNAPQGMVTDPVTGTTMSAASTSPGALRTRGNAVAEPQFRDALQTFIAHTKQMEHWMAYAPILAEVNGVLRNREVQSAIQEKGGIEATKVLNLWLDLFAQGGNRDASNQLDLSQQITGMAGRGAQMALVGRLGTLLIQSTQLGAAIAEMPTGSYVVRLSKLLTGNLGWGEALNSPYVQRRIREMPPVVQQALEGLAATQPNRLKYEVARIGRLIAGTDGLMTAGTFAIVFDYHFTQAKKMGFAEADARAYARNVAERATDRIAQPTRMGARSIFELTQTNAYAKVGWAFASEARKNLALAAYGVANRPAGDAARTIGGLLILNILFGSLIRNAWRDARDEEDDEWFDDRNWSGKRLLLSAFTEPFYGLPFIGAAIEEGAYAAAGEYNMAGNVLSPVRAIRALRNLPETLSGEREVEDMMKDLNGLMWVMGLFNQNIAAATSLSNIAVDAFSLGKNAKENLEE